MDEKNRNISDTFGKYNNSVGEIKNVSSKDWVPISTGNYNEHGNAAGGKKATPGSKQNKKNVASKNPQKSKNSSGKGAKERGFISEGKPVSQTGKTAGKAQPEKSQNKNTSSGKKKSSSSSKKQTAPKEKHPSRTPVGRDMREDAKKQQKHREELFKSREDYERQTKDGMSHDEISRSRNRKKRKKLRVKNAVTAGAVLLFALIFIAVYCYSRGALIETIIIDGGSIYTAEEIYQAAGISKGKNMLSLREKKVRRDVTTKLPYIKDVQLDFDLPDTVILTIKATSDKYVITGTGNWLTLDTDGKVVSESKQKIKDGMFRVDGFDSQLFSTGDTYVPEGTNQERYKLTKKIVALFEKSGVVKSAVINVKNTEDVCVIYNEKVAVYLGDCKNLEEKIPYASGIIAEVTAAGKTGYIDMRFDLGFFKPGSMTIE